MRGAGRGDGKMGPTREDPGRQQGCEPERAAAALFVLSHQQRLVLQPLGEPAEYFPVFICGKA